MLSMIELGLDSFVWRALLGAAMVVLLTAPMGCFVVWQRMAFFGDALAHSALLGVALGLLLGVSLSWSVLIFCVLAALVLVAMQNIKGVGSELSSDTRLGVVAHTGLAGGLVLLAFTANTGFDLNAYLFGDVLTITATDLWRMLLVVIVVLTVISFLWRRLLFITISADLAQVEGVPVNRLRSIFTLLLALVVATAIQVVGVLLTASLLVVPAAAARRLSSTPEQMVAGTLVIGLLSVLVGILSSLQWDLPAGPAIVLVSVFTFILVQLFKRN